MMRNFLLEIGLEEMPAHVVTPSMIQLKEKIEKFLVENRLSFESIEVFSTPRRLALRIVKLAEKQEDTREEVKGPAKKIAYDENGNLSKAVLGFLRGKGLTENEMTFKEVKGVEYVFATVEEKGKATEEILKELPNVILSMTFPVSMRWADNDVEFIRPIHWLVALFGSEIVPFSILGVDTSNTSRGHRLLEGVPTFSNADSYEEELAKFNVIANAAERKNLIRKQIAALEKENNWTVDLDEELLEEVNNLVEYPTAFAGSFDEKYLDVPEEVLITSMKEHQRFFDVHELDGKLSPHFISVRNGTDNHLANVIKGNEKVLVARLEDGEFFWKEDQRLQIADLVAKLSKVTFHEKIGTLAEHMLRTKKIGEVLAEMVELTETEKKDLKRAADIYKFDLVTNMVGEFPELQGIMGEKYAVLQGENEQTARAIREHYLPTTSEGVLPESKVGAILAVSDKLESLYSFFSVDLIPSGSNDPYALRRAVQGVIRILDKFGWKFSFADLQEKIFTAINAETEIYKLTYTNEKEALSFVKGRVRQLLSGKITRHDILDAVVNAEQSDISELFATAEVLNAHQNDENFRLGIESLTRVVNLAQKAEVAVDVNTSLFENEYEKALNEKIISLEENFTGNAEEKYQQLMSLSSVINEYFDNTMVMTDNEQVKNNRLSELQKLAKIILSFASVDLLIVK
ncbi:glycine--tRNA ligase subunit beta [Pilibacter termitis]|nr:glycine--tRNA ligase subunit beta [Pilibacter termitis]